MRHFVKIASAVAFAFACSGANAASLLTNGSFEADAGDVAIGGYTTVNAGQPTIDGWTVVGTSVDLIRGWQGTIDGVSVDLAGTPGPGGIKQEFAAFANYSYHLSWEYFTNGADPINLVVSVGSGSSILGSLSIGNAPSAATSAFLDFTTPTSGQYYVQFFTSNATNAGPTVDNINLVVTAVPEPAEWAMLLAGLVVLGMVARRRAQTHANSAFHPA